jgi:hypothetical protein
MKRTKQGIKKITLYFSNLILIQKEVNQINSTIPNFIN